MMSLGNVQNDGLHARKSHFHSKCSITQPHSLTLTQSGTHPLMAINYKKSKVNMQKSLVRSIEINMILGFIDAFNADRKSDTPDGLITIE